MPGAAGPDGWKPARMRDLQKIKRPGNLRGVSPCQSLPGREASPWNRSPQSPSADPGLGFALPFSLVQAVLLPLGRAESGRGQ